LLTLNVEMPVGTSGNALIAIADRRAGLVVVVPSSPHNCAVILQRQGVKMARANRDKSTVSWSVGDLSGIGKATILNAPSNDGSILP